MQQFAFMPPSIMVVLGVNNTLPWVSEDYVAHTVTATDRSFDSGLLSPGGNFTYTFTKPGTYTYFCSLHPSMMGMVIVLGG